MGDQIEAMLKEILAQAKCVKLSQNKSGVYIAEVSPSRGIFFWRKSASLPELLNQVIEGVKEWEGSSEVGGE